MVLPTESPIANPKIVFRQEYDEWALLFNPDTGEVYGINPVAAYVWKHLDGRQSLTEIIGAVRDAFEEVPQSVDTEVLEFVGKIEERGFLGREV